ncbi:MAG TPA: mechanosensitive ion channel family protein [Pyrinomonadaceae bacterium]|nr:mechanosensitive ion channel family protein [Pyrinomonadaceae bacterium]
MNRPELKKQIALPLAAAAFFGLVLYFLSEFSPPEPPASAPEQVRVSFMAYEWAWNLVCVFFFVSLSLIAVRALNELVFFIFRKRKGYEAPSLMRDIFSLAAYVISIALILKYFFPNLSFGALLSGSALLGIILGLALQDTLGNLFAGISLHADKPFQVGDVITVGKWTGVVESITWRAVKIKTFQNHIVLVSNSSIAKESIEVCPRDNANARIVFFGAHYSDSPTKVIHAVREAIRECDNVLRYMTPVVRIRNFGDSNVEYEVKYWLSDYARYNDTDALIRQRVWYAFRRNGLTFAFPTRTVQMEQPAAAPDARQDAETLAERLSAVDIFSPLTSDELSMLALNSAGRVFAPGETIIREGDPGSSMFIVHRGSVDVRVDNNGQRMTIKTLQEGDFFGEMALFTGEPRTAHVIAAEETEVLEIGHAAMKALFETNPDLVESLSHTINERRRQLAANSPAAASEQDTPAGILDKIKRFFRLD